MALIKKFDKMIVDVIADLRKHRRADCESIHNKIFNMANFSNINKEELMNRTNILIKSILYLESVDRINTNNQYYIQKLRSLYVNKNTSP